MSLSLSYVLRKSQLTLVAALDKQQASLTLTLQQQQQQQ
jgi:hypothetical protein